MYITVMINQVFIYFSAVQIYDLSYIHFYCISCWKKACHI